MSHKKRPSEIPILGDEGPSVVQGVCEASARVPSPPLDRRQRSGSSRVVPLQAAAE